MPTITIDDEVWSELQTRFDPLVYTANGAIRELLKLPPMTAGLVGSRDYERTSARPTARSLSSASERPVSREIRTRDADFRIPILQALASRGGRAEKRDVLVLVGKTMESTLKPIDYTTQGQGIVRWEESASFERLHMSRTTPPLVVLEGPGLWKITAAGREYLAKTASERESAS